MVRLVGRLAQTFEAMTVNFDLLTVLQVAVVPLLSWIVRQLHRLDVRLSRIEERIKVKKCDGLSSSD